MAFAIRYLGVLAYTHPGGFTLWHYKTGTDTLDTVCAGNYFVAASDRLSIGDMIMVSVRDGCRVVCVAATSGDTVTVAPLS